MKRLLPVMILMILPQVSAKESASLWLEAESFSDKGGWVVDQQFMDVMGSPYLMAHRLGTPVADAVTEVTFPAGGDYQVYVRTCNWAHPWFAGSGPGRFQLLVNGKPTGPTLGADGAGWMWQSAGSMTIAEKRAHIALHDLTGFNGRCDAIYFTQGAAPPDELNALAKLRQKHEAKVRSAGRYDLVVVGGGVAGTCAAITAARLGLKVALIQDRPVLGGNNSSEVRVHLGGRIHQSPFPALGDVVKELGPSRGGNAQPADIYEDDKKLQLALAEENIALFLNYRAVKVSVKRSRISAVFAKHIESGEVRQFRAPLFADCTGDGVIGYLAGADFMIGRESRDQFGEETAPETADAMVMGASVQWYSVEESEPASFPVCSYGVDFSEESCQPVKMGDWNWETGMNRDPIADFEQIRDYGLLVVFSNWSFLKNKSLRQEEFRNSRLAWAAYVAGKRESRRLVGDLILTEGDIKNFVRYPDGTASTTWTIDLHYPDPQNSEHFYGREFQSIAKHIPIYPYPIPYRCLYSRNIDNLFMAGRNISVTHVALGTVRVMRTTGMMGEVVGMAAAVCKKHVAKPRDIYEHYWEELVALMNKGAGKHDVENYQNYNLGNTLGPALYEK